MKQKTILPGATIGVLGSGQLGRMFAIAARRMGYRVHVLSPDNDTPTGQVADVEIRAAYDDLDAVAQFARSVDAVTFEFENVPMETIVAVEGHTPVRPGGHVLHTTQNRLREKAFLRNAGFPVTPFHAVRAVDDLEAGRRVLGSPAVLKTAAWGYDGKGQRRIEANDSTTEVWSSMKADECVLEKFVDFASEISVVAARGSDGAIACYDPIMNMHENHILDVSLSPAGLAPAVVESAKQVASRVLESLDVVGVLCVEFFLTRNDDLLINELAPRPHNSGHLTIDAHMTCQFQQQVAICGLPLGSTLQLRPAAMANLLGDLWRDGEPRWQAACAQPDTNLHLYGKLKPLPGRKMGHLTTVAETTSVARDAVLKARESLCSAPVICRSA